MQGSTPLYRVGFVVGFLGARAYGRFEGVGDSLGEAEAVIGAATVVGHFGWGWIGELVDGVVGREA